MADQKTKDDCSKAMPVANNNEKLEVIGAGFPRTGTMSTRAALEHLLEGPVYHDFVPIGERPDHVPLWMKMFKSGQLDPEVEVNILQGFRGGLDTAIIIFYKELMELYPSAKVLLTVRDPHKWFVSMTNLREITGTVALKQPYVSVLRMMGLGLFVDFLVRIQEPDMPGIQGRINRALAAGEEEAVAVFNAHVEEVRAHVPSEKLLIFEAKEGWEPLCSFLKLSIPAIPFPNVNGHSELIRVFSLIRLVCWMIMLAVPVVLACLLPRCDTLGETALCFVLVAGLVPAMGRVVSFLINRHATTKK